MDEELVSESSLSEYEMRAEDGGEDDHPLLYSEQFYEVLPWYLSIGMTPEQFWDQDCMLTYYYREAERHREDKFNRQAHLQGLYFYEALCDVSPIMVAFPAKSAKPLQYPEKPYELRYEGETDLNETEKSAEEIQMDKNKAKMEAFMVGFNNAFKEKRKKEEMTNA